MGRDPGLGRKSWQDRIAFLGGRCKEIREDSDNAGVRGHKESTKNGRKYLGGGTRGGRRSRGVNQSQSGSRGRTWRRVNGESQRLSESGWRY